MATYLILNVAVMAAVGLALAFLRVRVNWRIIGPLAGVLLVLTAAFDSLIIHAGIVAYEHAKIVGVFIGRAPIEDFAYTLVAVVLVPYVWVKLREES